jgi:hypothetical protein
MTEHEWKREMIPARSKPNGHYCWQQNEMYDLVQKIVGPTAFAVYANLTRKAYGYDPRLKFALRGLAADMGQSHATVGRELTVLKRLNVVRLKVAGGNRPSEWELTDLRELVKCWGATYNKRTGSCELDQLSTECLRDQVDRLRRDLQGKTDKTRSVSLSDSIPSPNFERDASVSPERQQCYSRETQTGSHHLIENRRQENNLSPTPFHVGELSKSKDFPDERRIEMSLKRACDLFCGVMNEMKDHLVVAGRPQLAHLEDSYEDWRRFRFESLGVVEASESDDSVRLVLCASDTAAAQLGLAKYRKTWHSSLVRWFGCKVDVQWQSVHDGPRGGGLKSLGSLRL